jgi:hypothetical protein
MSSDDLLGQIAADLVRMDENGIAATTIKAVVGLDFDELELIRQSPEYAAAKIVFLKAKTQSVIQARERRENIVKQALMNVEASLMENGDGDFALRSLVTMHRLGKEVDNGENMRNINTPDGFVTLQIPSHLLGNISGVDAARISAQQVHAATQTKEVGMIGQQALRQYMGLNDGPAIEGEMSEAASPAKAAAVFDFQALL